MAKQSSNSLGILLVTLGIALLGIFFTSQHPSFLSQFSSFSFLSSITAHSSSLHDSGASSLSPLAIPTSHTLECGNVQYWKTNKTLASLVHNPSSPQWGSYRPGVYFGMKTKTYPVALTTGILWSEGKTIYNRNFRHSVRQDELDHFEWLRNDGETFGVHSFLDLKSDANITASYLIHSPYRWTQQFQVQKQKYLLLPFLFYFGLECDLPQVAPKGAAGASAVKKSKNCLKKGTFQHLEFVSQVDLPLAEDAAAAAGEGKEVPSSYSTLTQNIMIGYSELTKEWFSLTFTALGIALTEEELEEVIVTQGEKSFDYYSSLQMASWCPSSVVSASTSAPRTMTGIQNIVDEIQRSSEVNRQRAMEASQVNADLAASSTPENAEENRKKMKTSHEGYLFDAVTMMLPSQRIDSPSASSASSAVSTPSSSSEDSSSSSLGVVTQVMTRKSFELTVDYETNPSWQSREDVLSALGHDKDTSTTSSAKRRDAFLQTRSAHQISLKQKQESFIQQFQHIFSGSPPSVPLSVDSSSGSGSVSERGTADEVAMRCLSNLLGGLGYFHGTSTIGNSDDFTSYLEQTLNTEEKRKFQRSEAGRLQHIPLTLFTATPSRSSFPRGFLWDEGFHQLLINKWNPEITMDVLNHWLQSMLYFHPPGAPSDSDGSVPVSAPAASAAVESNKCSGGWIPREMILGDAANRVVPGEFITQRVDIANPPTLLLVINDLLDRYDSLTSQCQASSAASTSSSASASGECMMTAEFSLKEQLSLFFTNAFPRLHQWVTWFISSQAGPQEGSFRWRGRKLDPNRLMTNTLASGLDDYPRGSMPSNEEFHLDLLCWIISSLKTMHRLQQVILQHRASTSVPPSDSDADLQELLTSPLYSLENIAFYSERLEKLHWSEELRGFYDVGIIGSNERIDKLFFVHCVLGKGKRGVTQIQVTETTLNIAQEKQELNSLCPASFPFFAGLKGDSNGQPAFQRLYVTDKPHRVSFLPRHGYVNLFPFLLHILPSHATLQLTSILDIIESTEHLWTPYGLRSISKTDLFYQVENAPGDAPYWRGPIWMPINYLTLKALKFYSQASEEAIDEKDVVRQRCQELHEKLRANLVRNVLKEYHATGYFWEQYDDRTGDGIRGHPFTGWTSLFVSILYETY